MCVCVCVCVCVCAFVLQLDIEVAKAASVPFPPPLDEGMEEDKYEAFVKTPPPSPTPEVNSYHLM